MEAASFRSVFAMLAVLAMPVALVTHLWRYGNLDLTGRWANLRGVYARAIAVGVVLAAILRANVIDILQNPEVPGSLLGWYQAPWAEGATAVERVRAVVYEIIGVLTTGLVLAFVSRLWNDLFDIVYEIKRWIRGRANQLKPEEGSVRPAPVTQAAATVSRPRRSRRGGRGRSSSGSGGSGGGASSASASGGS